MGAPPLYPEALQRLLPEADTAALITPRVLIYHSIVGSGASAYGYFLRGTSLEATFVNPRSDEPNGDRVWQLMPCNRRADANADANRFAISVETGDRGQPDTQPWDPGQVRRNIALGVWVVTTQPNVQRIRCPAWNGSGIGYHSMWGAPSHWTPARGKTCPGKARIAQFEREVLPQILAEAPPGTTYDPQEDPVALTPAQAAQLTATAAAVARLEEAVGKLPAKATAVRMARTSRDGTKAAGQVWVVTPAGCWAPPRAALNFLLMAGTVVELPGTVDPDYLEGIPTLSAA